MSKAALRRPDHVSPPPGASQSGTFAKVPVRTVLTCPHPALATRAVDVDPRDPRIIALADALVATMRISPACVGLAATQIGEPYRVFAMDLSGHKRAKTCAGLVVMANPRIVARSHEVVMREGCMSVPDWTGNVSRSAEVEVVGVEPGSGRPIRVRSNAMEARCLQHEIDHLDGYVFVQRVADRTTDLFPRKTYA